MKHKQRIGAYLRVSTSEQSTSMQREEIAGYAKARGWSQLFFYEDKLTGTDANRPELQRLLADASRRKIDIIIVFKLDRLARSLRDLIDMLDSFGSLGISLISLKENIDLTSSTGRLLTHLLGAFAQFERDLIVSRVRSGLDAAKRKGIKLGRPQIVDHKKVLELSRKSLSLRQIALQLKVSKSAVHKSLKQHPVTNRSSTRLKGVSK